MEAATIFTAVSLMMFANGLVLVLVSRDLPVELRPAANWWQIGTMLIAIGCAVFAFGAPLPRPVMLFGANATMVLGLTAYQAAIQSFCGKRARPVQLLPAAIAISCGLWFSLVTPDFRMRVLAVSAVWDWLMLASIVELRRGSRDTASVSSRILIGIFALVLVYTLVRLTAYLSMGLGPDFALETGSAWPNLVSPIIMTLLPVVGTTAFLLMCSDRLRRQLETAAATDYLTGLPNRRAFSEQAATSFDAARRHADDLAVAVLDIDHFKWVNDTHGHDVGDQALAHVAHCLVEQARDTGMIARTGGEEFTVLLAGLGPAEAIAAVERMLRAVEHAPFDHGLAPVPLTLSAGIAARAGDQTFDEMLRRADNALYRAKHAGRNRLAVSPLPDPVSAPVIAPRGEQRLRVGAVG